MQRPKYWLTDLVFAVCACQTHRDPSARVLVDWQNVELFTAHPQDRPILYVGVGCFEWYSYSSHQTLDVPTPPVPAYYSNLVLRPYCAQQNLIWAIALTRFAICTVMRFCLGTRDGVLSNRRHTTALQLGYMAILSVSAGD